ncbi:hypothetical protein BR93DRAFT_581219 [Coniochaeta sp. PMI_546]|nr:hypothetical protein BR93DRAFT_581219 [Coniochaeta sp. PMI_546]
MTSMIGKRQSLDPYHPAMHERHHVHCFPDNTLTYLRSRLLTGTLQQYFSCSPLATTGHICFFGLRLIELSLVGGEVCTITATLRVQNGLAAAYYHLQDALCGRNLDVTQFFSYPSSSSRCRSVVFSSISAIFIILVCWIRRLD